MLLRFLNACMIGLGMVSIGLPGRCDTARPLTATQTEFFEAHIRPVLVEQCYKCHSAASAQGGLALDTRAALLRGGNGGVVVMPGKPERSRLIAVIQHDVPGLEMPRGSMKLDPGVIANFSKWIAMGAPDPRAGTPPAPQRAAAAAWDKLLAERKKWWSFQPIKRPSPPVVPGNCWSDHPVDRFILAKLAQHGLAPAAPAAPRTLVRRLYFALVGLPPTPEELSLWKARLQRRGGYEALVDHLLSTPQFGETWARHWMDWTRYADSNGSEGDPEIVNGWLYRDYLIRALNGDVGYDQLVREHVAGDLLPQPRLNTVLGINESIIGLAHWRMVYHGYAPTDALAEKVRFTDDEIAAFSKAFLGLTVSCARCHNHKFDAISQRDYYALFGVLASCRPGRSAIDLPARLDRNRDRLAALKPQIRAAVAAIWLSCESRLRQRLADVKASGLLLNPLRALRDAGSDRARTTAAWQRIQEAWQADRREREEYAHRAYKHRWNFANPADYAAWLRQGTGLPASPSPAGEFAVATSGDAALAGIYPAGIYTHALSAKHAARLSSRYVRLDGDYELWVRALGDGGATLRYVAQDYPRDGAIFPISRLTPTWQWQRFDMTYWKGDDVHVELADSKDAPLMAGDEARSWFGVREAVIVRKGDPPPPAAAQEALDPLFAAIGPAQPESADQLADAYVRAILAAVAAWRDGAPTDAQALLLAQCFEQDLLPNVLGDLAGAQPLIAEYRRLEAEIESPTRVPVLAEGVARNQPLYERGDHKHPAAEAPRGFLAALDPQPYRTAQSGRLELVADLLRDDNPLTRRVIVNRIWHHLFGRGIVATPDNFGKLGQEPTHPELLDYLATRFKDHGWSIKDTIRFIVTAKTWQLASLPSPQARRTDPENRFLSHANVRRLDAEAIRDSLLAVSGALDPALYGAPVGGDSPRRSVYVRVQRNALDPFLRAFDFPEPFSATGSRDVTNVPAQSLTLLNDPHVASLAAVWAARIGKDTTKDTMVTDTKDLIRRMFVAALGRPATKREAVDAESYMIESHEAHRDLLLHADDLSHQLEAQQAALNAILEPARGRLLRAAQADSATLPGAHPAASGLPQPIGRWEFKDGLQDLIGVSHGQAVNGARIQEGALRVGDQGYVITAPLQKTIREKTLEAWVQLDTLDQGGGGVMSIMTPDGNQFDAIVYGEREPRQWMAGSDGFGRTQSFGAPQETEADRRPVHFAIVYQADGRISGYRDGLPYGHAYQSAGPIEFKAGQTVIGFGIRHLPAGGNKLLAGRILRAQLYDRALSSAEVLESSRSAGSYISPARLLAALSAADRDRVAAHERRIGELEAEIKALGPIPAADDSEAPWRDLGQALFNFKEFIYLN